MSRIVRIMRGLPGSGKSAFVANYYPGALICSADHYHINPVTNAYSYNPENTRAAHDACFLQYMRYLNGADLVADGQILVVDNTNTTIAEVAPYYRLAEISGSDVDVEIIRLVVPFEVACARNIHGVPPETIWKMYLNLLNEKLPPWYRERIHVVA